MGDYVDREKIVADILGLTIVDPAVMQYADAVLRIVQSAQKENVAPIKYGVWIYDPDATDWGIGGWVCSECKQKNNLLTCNGDVNPFQFVGSSFCPSCGAKMTKCVHTKLRK